MGSETPRKNFSLLLEAFQKLKQNKKFSELKLVKVGNAGGSDATALRAATISRIASLGLDDDVIFTGYLPEGELAKYYSMAQCFVFPSLYEGFGVPPLEAMACGCPVIVSDRTSLPEVVGDAGIKIDPTKAADLANIIINLIDTPPLRQDLISKGLKRAQLFSWEKTAAQIYKIYQQEGYLS